MSLYERLYAFFRHQPKAANLNQASMSLSLQTKAQGTYVRKQNAAWLQKDIGSLMPIRIWCWRSVNVRFLRTFIHERFAGRWLLKLIFWKEELIPHFLGKYGQFPLVVLDKNK
jgi:hypothetical protein